MIDIKLTSKAISEPIRHNAYYKLVIMLAIVNHCAYGNKASIQLIHLIFWGLRTESNYQVMYDFSKKVRTTITPWSFETGIHTILSLSFANEYCEKIITGGNLEIKITPKGAEVLKKINEADLFTEDILKISKLGKIPKNRINNANNNWALI